MVSRLLAVLGTLFLVAACDSSESRIASMAARPSANSGGTALTDRPGASATNVTYRGAIALRTVRGEPGTGILYQQVTTKELSEALRRSLLAAGYLSDSPRTARYVLDVELDPISRPFAGATFEIRTTARYRLVEVASNREVLSISIEETGVAKWGEYPDATQRLRVAELRSVRQSIGRLLTILGGAAQS